MPLVQCRDSDGWRWASRLRDFDLSLCAEEGLILPSFLAILVVAALARLCLFSYPAARDISRSSRWRLWAKLVRLFCLHPARADSVSDTAWPCVPDQSNQSSLHSHRPDQHSCSTPSCIRTSCTPPRPVLDPFQPPPNTVLLQHPLALLALLHHRTIYLDTVLRAVVFRRATRSLKISSPLSWPPFLYTRMHLS